MKHPSSFRLRPGKLPVLAGLLLLGALPLRGNEPETQEATPAPAATSTTATAAEPTPADPKREALREILARFSAAFDSRDFARAAEVLAEAEKLAPDDPIVRTARAGIYAESGEIGKAREIYLTLVKEEADPFVPRYNLAELYFLEKEYAKGREAFRELLKDYPASDLVRFKIVLSHIAEKDPAAAREAMAPLQRATPTAFALYAAAALALDQGQIRQGKEMILAAERFFGPGQQKLLYDSLAELGLVMRGDYPPGAAQSTAQP